MAFAVALSFASCNQKERKLSKIIDGITAEQKKDLKEIIIGSTIFLEPDSFNLNIVQQKDTVFFCIDEIDIGTKRENPIQKNGKENTNDEESFRESGSVDETVEQESTDESFESILELCKPYLLSAFCSESSNLKELLQQIADVPACIVIVLGDSPDISQSDFIVISSAELKKALLSECSTRTTLTSYIDLISTVCHLLSEESDEIAISAKLNNNYVELTLELDSLFNSLEEEIQSDIEDAKNSFWGNIDDILDLDEYKEEIRKAYIKDRKEMFKERFTEDGLDKEVSGYIENNFYLTKLFAKNNIGFKITFIDRTTGESIDIFTIEPDELKHLIK